MSVESAPPLTYGRYLRVPELLELQSPLAEPAVHEEMLFIIGQQAEELWFRQCLFELRAIIDLLSKSEIVAACLLLDRVNRILRVLAAETELLQTISPAQFHQFRGYLRAASGLESEQFRELEIASGLRDDAYLKLVCKLIDLPAMLARWPISLRDAFRAVLVREQQLPADRPDAVAESVMRVYRSPAGSPELFRLAEALSDYELRFREWRFHHLQVVERVIGDRAPGTGGSPGNTYLGRTLSYRFFPELWEARNRLTMGGFDSAP